MENSLQIAIGAAIVSGVICIQVLRFRARFRKLSDEALLRRTKPGIVEVSPAIDIPRVVLDDLELARLERIINTKNLETQRTSTYLIFIQSALLIAAASYCLLIDHKWSYGLFGLAALGASFGFMRLGYYKLFRMIHYLHQSLETPQIQIDSSKSV